MTINPVISMLGRKLWLAVVGGGSGSFIGAMHRQAARFDDRYELVAGYYPLMRRNQKQPGWNWDLLPTERTQMFNK